MRQSQTQSRSSDEYNEVRVITRVIEPLKLDTHFSNKVYDKVLKVLNAKYSQKNQFLCHDIRYQNLLFRKTYENDFDKDPKVQLFSLELQESEKNLEAKTFRCVYKRTIVPMHNLPSTKLILSNIFCKYISYRINNNLFLNLEQTVEYDISTDTYYPLRNRLRFFVWNRQITPAQDRAITEALKSLESIFETETSIPQ
jgi:hypothetical protein